MTPHPQLRKKQQDVSSGPAPTTLHAALSMTPHLCSPKAPKPPKYCCRSEQAKRISRNRPCHQCLKCYWKFKMLLKDLGLCLSKARRMYYRAGTKLWSTAFTCRGLFSLNKINQKVKYKSAHKRTAGTWSLFPGGNLGNHSLEVHKGGFRLKIRKISEH